MNIKRLFKIISIMLLVIMLFPYNSIVMAATVSEVGNAIATFAKNYYDKVQNGEAPYTYHPGNSDYPGYRSFFYAKRAIPSSGEPPLNGYAGYGISFEHYGLDCVGWVSFCIYNSTGLEYGSVTDGSGGYVVPEQYGGPKKFFETVTDGPQPGDIGYSQKHVVVCIGDRKNYRF